MDRQIWRKAEDIPLFSIIVFSERCDLKKVTVSNENVKVIKRDRMYDTVKTIWDAYPDVLSKEQIKKLIVLEEQIESEYLTINVDMLPFNLIIGSSVRIF